MPASVAVSSVAYVVSNSTDWFRIQQAMAKHCSQYMWFRNLHMAFSRYVVVNTFEPLNARTWIIS